MTTLATVGAVGLDERRALPLGVAALALAGCASSFGARDDAGVALERDAGSPPPPAPLRPSWSAVVGSDSALGSLFPGPRGWTDREAVQGISVDAAGTVHAVASLRGPSRGLVEVDGDDGETQGVYLQLDSTGALRRSVALRGGGVQVMDVSADGEDGAYVCGRFLDELAIGELRVEELGIDGFVARVGADGAPRWLVQERSVGTSLVLRCEARPDGGVIVLGEARERFELGETRVDEPAGAECCDHDQAFVAWLDETGGVERVADRPPATDAVRSFGSLRANTLVRTTGGHVVIAGEVAPGWLSPDDGSIRHGFAMGFGPDGAERWRLETEAIAAVHTATARTGGGAWLVGSFQGEVALGGRRVTGRLIVNTFLAEIDAGGAVVSLNVLPLIPSGEDYLGLHRDDDALLLCGSPRTQGSINTPDGPLDLPEPTAALIRIEGGQIADAGAMPGAALHACAPTRGGIVVGGMFEETLEWLTATESILVDAAVAAPEDAFILALER